MDLQCSSKQANNGEGEHQITSSTEDDEQSQNSLTTESTPPPNIPQQSPLDVSSNSQTGDGGLHHVSNGISPSQPFQNGTKAEDVIALDDDKKREHKRRSKNWTRAETLKLIKMRTEFDERFRRSGKKAMLWEEIALALQRDKFSRDGQQCKDKWEKLTAAYKEVRDGTRESSEHPFFNELNALLSWKSYKKECDGCGDGNDAKRVKFELNSNPAMIWNQAGVSCSLTPHLGTIGMTEVRFDHKFSSVELKEMRHSYGVNSMDMNEACRQDSLSPRKRRREEVISSLDSSAVRELVDSIITRQQSFLKDLLDALDRKERLKEQMRHEREEKWRAEERAQRFAFNAAMIRLTQRLLGERPPPTAISMDVVPASMVATTSNGGMCTKKRSKNWKKSEVANLIRIRQEMDSKFAMSTRRAGLWDELGEKLASLGTQRDGKQCREKWDKLMAEYKDVVDGRKDKDESTYFGQLSTIMGKLRDGDAKSSSETTKDDCASDKKNDECGAAVDR